MRIRYWRSDVCSPELDRRFHLVPVAEAVEQAELHGLLPAVGRAVDEVAHRAGFQVARFGHGGDDLRERRIEVALQVLALRLGQRVFGQETHGALVLLALGDLRLRADVVQQQIGRASCRERVWQYVYISGVAVSLKKKKQNN